MTSPWVQGAYTPVDNEIDAVDLPMTGSLPPEFSGMLMRIGVSPIGDVPEDHNLFFGDGMLHGLTFDRGNPIAYRNRWVRTEPVSQKLGEKPNSPPRGGEDVSNTHVLPFAGKLYSMTETCIPYRINADCETDGRDDFGGFIEGGFTAHPHIDNATGQLHAIGYDVNDASEATHYVFEADGTPLRKTTLALGGSSWIHDFAMTESFLVLWDLPLQYYRAGHEAAEKAPYKWNPDYHTKVGLRPLAGDTDDVVWFDAPSCFVFHPVNAWEERDADGKVTHVVCDVARYAKMFDQVRTGPGDMVPPQIVRWTFDLASNTLKEDMVDMRIQEFPRIDDRYWGRKSRFSVTTELFRFSGGSGLIGYYGDGSTQAYNFGEGNVTSEGIFVPYDETASEGEGHVIAMVANAQSGATKTVVFDAERIGKGPIAEIIMPQRVPYTFHGSWLPAA